MAEKHIIILGPPGSGKGTQAVRIAEQLGLKHLSTGDVLRESLAAGSDLGMKAKAFMDRGLLVPDKVMLGLIEKELCTLNGSGWILDGFPRTLPQAQELTRMLEDLEIEVDHIIRIDVDSGTIVKRISGRRVCESCKAVYNTASMQGGECEKCGGKLIKRQDDEESTILRRFRVYEEQTQPVLDYYTGGGAELITIDGSKKIDDITADIFRAVK